MNPDRLPGPSRLVLVAIALVAIALVTSACGLWLGSEPIAAHWRLDPAHEAPGRDATEVHVLLMEVACASGTSPQGRISEPRVEYSAVAVTISIGVRPLSGAADCQGNPEVPVTVRLQEPLGDRQLIDGGQVEPVPASTPTPRVTEIAAP